MGKFVSIRGWIECECDVVAAMVSAIEGFELGELSGVIGMEQYALYMKGWRFPLEQIGWTAYLFYGCDVRACACSVLWAQVTMLAGIGEDVYGYFQVDSDDGEMSEEWRVGGGRVVKRAIPSSVT